MPLTKKPNWQLEHFHAFLLDNATTPFSWGENDCCLFAANAILANTSTDIASEFRGKYTTQAGAIKAIKTITGGSTVADAVAYVAQQHSITGLTYPLMAKRGDLVLIENAGTLIAGVIHLNGYEAISVAETGAVRIPITNVVRAWSV